MAQQQQDDFQKVIYFLFIFIFFNFSYRGKQQNRDKLRGRRKGGVQFMDSQIRSLIKDIYKYSNGKGAFFFCGFIASRFIDYYLTE